MKKKVFAFAVLAALVLLMLVFGVLGAGVASI